MLPAWFVAHGSPMVAIEESEYAAFLETLGRSIPRPRAIVVFSAHWESAVQQVSGVVDPTMIYDFGGFPEPLYRVQYKAKGDPALAEEIANRLRARDIPVNVDTARGLDHGVWTILHRIYPQADIPVIAMSVNPNATPESQYAIGQALASLRQEDVLFIGSGVTVHNFQLIPHRNNPEVRAMTAAFEAWVEEKLAAWDVNALFAYEKEAPNAELAVPANGKEHFVPLFYAMGTADDARSVETLHRSWLFGVMTNTVYQFG